jgi:hypothetical protein
MIRLLTPQPFFIDNNTKVWLKLLLSAQVQVQQQQK